MQFPTIFSTDSAKAAKASGYGYLNAIHYMAPASTGGAGNLCPKASPECIALCLGTYSGQAAMVSDLENGTNNVRESRKAKARLFMHRRNEYLNEIARKIVRVILKAKKERLIPCIRLNGSTDIPFERLAFDIEAKTAKALAEIYPHQDWTLARTNLIALFPKVQFVDYTKISSRLGKQPTNLDLTLSYSAQNSAECVNALMSGHNVAMVFHGSLPNSFAGFPVIDGDTHDLRHLDRKGGFIVGLSPKGNKAKRDQSGFVVDWQGERGKALERQWGALRGIRAGTDQDVYSWAIDTGRLIVQAA